MPVWPHAPPHYLGEGGAYMVTAGTYGKEAFFGDGERLRLLHDLLLNLAERYGWALEAWAVFPNHYHFVGRSAEDGAGSLVRFLQHLHSQSARELNRLDSKAGRKIWHNYYETHLTYEESYLARLHYVHANAVKHGVAAVAADYCWCSAGWFEKVAEASRVETVYSFKTDRVRVVDDF